MERNYYQNQDNEDNYPDDAYEAWDMDEPEEGEDDPFEGWGND
jgi:hypothetical protein